MLSSTSAICVQGLKFSRDGSEFYGGGGLNFELKFGDLREFRHFEPIFINSKFEILPFGMSEKVLIFESDEMAFEAQINFLQSYTRDEILIIRDQFELLALQSKEYKYALILGKSSDFGEILHVRNDEFNLFE